MNYFDAFPSEYGKYFSKQDELFPVICTNCNKSFRLHFEFLRVVYCNSRHNDKFNAPRLLTPKGNKRCSIPSR
jgi:hypothetical protein